MIIFNDPGKSPARTIMLNDVPVGATFRGIITSQTGRAYTGIWLKVQGHRDWIGQLHKLTGHSDVIVVGIRTTPLNADDGGQAVFAHCSTVTNYEPVDLAVSVINK